MFVILRDTPSRSQNLKIVKAYFDTAQHIYDQFSVDYDPIAKYGLAQVDKSSEIRLSVPFSARSCNA